MDKLQTAEHFLWPLYTQCTLWHKVKYGST